MKIKVFLLCLLATVAYSTAFSVQAVVVWDESSNGDLSNIGLAPTAVVFNSSNHVMNGTTGNAGSGVDRDYFTFTVPSGKTLSAIMVTNNTNVSGGSSFIAIQRGPQVTTLPSGAGSDSLLGFTHYGNDFVDTDILPTLVPSANGSLASGTYSIWVQETGGPATYGFNFVFATAPNTTAVPLPLATEILLFSGLFALANILRRRCETN